MSMMSGGVDDYPGRMLQQAAIYNNTDFLASLLEGEEAGNVDAQDIYGRTALYTSVTNNSLECARMLLNAQANPNISCGTQCGCMTPLHAAALDDKHQFVRLLLEHGADYNVVDASGKTPLELALKNRSQETAKIIEEEIDNRLSRKRALADRFISACENGNVMDAQEVGDCMTDVDRISLINNIPDGANCLLYRVCEIGNLEMVQFLISQGAEGLAHPISGMSPLHAAVQAGHTDVIRAVLKHFPELIQTPTIDGTLPQHMAVMSGNLEVVQTLLQYPYPDSVKHIERDLSDDHLYRLGFRFNARDGRGQNMLHVAASANQAEIMKVLVNFAVKPWKKHSSNNSNSSSRFSLSSLLFGQSKSPDLESPDCREATEDFPQGEGHANEVTIFPAEIDARDLDGHTPLHIAIMGDGANGYHEVAEMLLQKGADPNKPFISSSGNTTALMEACVRGDVTMMNSLLKHKALDTEHRVLSAAILSQHHSMISTLLKYNAYSDSEYKINKNAIIQLASGSEDIPDGYDSSCLPCAPVVINWYDLGLQEINCSWLMQASLMHNLHIGPAQAKLSLEVITRIDISNNHLDTLPLAVFSLKSLRLLNASENLIKFLDSGSKEDQDGESAFAEGWDAPLLEEIHLQKNKLKQLPSQLFLLPRLQRLNVSQNDLETIPYSIWTCSSLSDLNVSHNKLKHLPVECDHALPLLNVSNGEVDGISCEPNTTPTRATPGSYGSGGLTPNSGSLNSCGTPTDSQIETPSTESGEGTKTYKDMPVNRHVHWSSRVQIQILPLDSDIGGKGKRSVLSELNISHNLFETVPGGLSCLAPQLSKLILSNNKLTSIGPLGLYPVGLKWLDLSFNFITGIMDGKSEEELLSWNCFNPPQQSSRSKQKNASSPALRGPGGRANSSPSLSSMVPSSNALQPPGPCIHQSHSHLDQLKTLKLDHNRLVSLCVCLDKQLPSSEPSSLEEANKSPSRTRRTSNITGEHASLFFPSLTVLDVGHNALTTLPPDLSMMMHLTELKIPHNKIKELPPELGLLRKLWNLDVGDNPVERMLMGMLGDKAKKTAAVLGYLKSIKEEATLYNRMKLMFVGVQGIGKTSLLGQLRKEGKSSSSKNKNWAQRMGHGTIKDKDLKGDNISTVGVDIGDLILARGNKEIVFKTWDFGGQREYYATHQYFLTKRSLYLVMWKVTDGEKGVNDIMQWLVNIQARAPNAPVVIVGTHLDQVTKRKYPATYLQDLQQLIRTKYMCHSEPEKWGLPRVLNHIEISCRPKLMSNSHIGELVNLIFTAACEEQMPGSRGVRLVEQKVPATYVQLQDVVYDLAAERKVNGKDPVLHSEQYRPCVMSKMEEKFQTSFRDVAELNQATQFLHENGILLHYDDVNLQDVYFLDPQWLCDMLANVVTIREINSLAKFGIMKTDDLRILFKNAAFKPEDIKTYIIDLLNKFEVALLWDDKNLLIPSLLPTEEQVKRRLPQTDVRIPVKGSHISEYNPRFGNHLPVILNGPETNRLPQPREEGHSTFYLDHADYQDDTRPDMRMEADETLSRDGTTSDFSSHASSSEEEKIVMPRILANLNPAVALCRLYLMSYFPSGFWPRLITRLLGDETIFNIILSMYNLPDVVTDNQPFMQNCGTCPEWKCWQTGMELRHLGVPILSLKEASNSNPGTFCDYRKCKLVIRQEQEIDWSPLNLTSTSILELLIPNETLTVHMDMDRMDEGSGFDESVVLQPVPQATASIMAKMVDHIDTLLEDWYPDLGARFIQNSRGMYLITRIVPCVRCLLQQKQLQEEQSQGPDAWSVVDMSPGDQNPCITQPVMIDQQQLSLPLTPGSCPTPGSLGSTPSSHDEPSPVISQLSPGTTWSSSMYSSSRLVLETMENIYNKTATATGILPRFDRQVGFTFAVDALILQQNLGRGIFIRCPRPHKTRPPSDDNIMRQAPEVVFQDIGDQYVMESDHVTRGRFLGKGSFGAVFAGTMTHKGTGKLLDIAMKMLQPIDPGPEASPSHCQQYQAEKLRWDKEPMKNACEAYLNARKELTILLSLHHENIVPLLGICLQPLCLILSLAPLGSLNDRLKEHRRAGARLQSHTIQQIIIQTASALGYLHSCRIIYRDLKSENILVWLLPSPHSDETTPVDVKLADYGVSRAVLPSGAKGFAGTPPFIAPEIIQHSGEEAYTEKVDCFSFGMFIYELMMLKIPFEDGEGGGAVVANLKGHILAGGRPAITPKELTYPACLLDLMTLCWGHDPSERPSANEIEAIARTVEFSHLQDVVALETESDLEGNESDLGVLCACAAPYKADLMYDLEDSEEASFIDVWLSAKSSKAQCNQGQLLTFTFRKQQCLGSRSLDIEEGVTIGCICLVGKWLWCGDTSAIIHIYSLSDYTQVVKFSATTKPNLRIKTMVHAAAEKQVYIVMDRGSLVVCDAELPSSWGVNYTPVRMECPGNRKPIHCITVVPVTARSSALWCGQGKAKISVWNLSSTKGNVTNLSHGLETEMDNKNVVSITSEKDNPHTVWSYLYPGSEVFRWDTRNHNIVGRLDVSLAIPDEDRSALELTLEGTLEESRCHVTCLCAVEDKLYIGTSWGCVVVCHATQMQVLSVMRVHGEDWPNTQIILPLTVPGLLGELQDDVGVISIGRGYRDVIERYIKVYESRIPTAVSSMYLLTWNTKKWTL